MYQWRKFEFFEEKYGGKCKVPEEITAEITCCSSGRGKAAIGCDDGTVSILDRGFKFNYAFQAHSSSVLFLQQLKVNVFFCLLLFWVVFVMLFRVCDFGLNCSLCWVV